MYREIEQTTTLIIQICQSVYTPIPYLHNEVGRGNVPRKGAEVDTDPPFLMSCKLGIVLIIQGDAGKGCGDGGRVTGVDLLENDWRELRGIESEG